MEAVQSFLLIKVSDQEEPIKIDRRIENLSILIRDFIQDSSEDQIIPLPNLTKELLEKVIEYSELHEFEPVEINRPIKSGELIKNLQDIDYQFIKDYDIKTVKPIHDASSYLNMKSLFDVCSCRIATEYYIEPSMDGIEAAKKKFGITEDLTQEQVV